MSFRTRTAVAITAVALVALSGCAPEPSPIVPEPTSTTPPLFASDEEALAAAEEAYREYLRVSATISSEGGKDPERIAPLVSPDLKEQTVESSRLLLDQGRRTVGEYSFDSASLQQYADAGDGTAQIVAYMCTDVTAVRILAADGADVTPNRPNRLPLELVFSATGPPTELILESSDLWSGEDFCME